MSLPKELLDKFDEAVKERKYLKRSEAIREAMRDFIVETKWTKEKGIIHGTLTMVYDHEVHGVTEKLIDVQHNFNELIKASMHLHLDKRRCMEILALQGEVNRIKELFEVLGSQKGVENVKLSIIDAR